MANVCFFSFSETDRTEVLLIKGRAVNPFYYALDFRVQDLISRWNTTDPAVIRQAISKAMYGTSRTIVFVGSDTWQSYWVPQEVAMTIENGKAVYAIRVPNTNGIIPSFLTTRNIPVYAWSEANLQAMATR
jgi:hypothetical protein